jgi:hypothetical protein
MQENRICLSGDDFRRLVAGEVVEHTSYGKTTKIILSDIGWECMLAAIHDAMNASRELTPS